MGDRFLKVGEACKVLGMSRPSLFRLCTENRVPHYNLGKPGARRTLRFSEQELRAFMAAHHGGAVVAG